MARVTSDAAQLRVLSKQIAQAFWDQNAVAVKNNVRAEAPVDTGLLRSRHTVTRLERQPTGWVFHVSARTNYASHVYLGHKIPPSVKRRKGGVVFKPGGVVPGNPWIRRGFERSGLPNVRDLQ